MKFRVTFSQELLEIEIGRLTKTAYSFSSKSKVIRKKHELLYWAEETNPTFGKEWPEKKYYMWVETNIFRRWTRLNESNIVYDHRISATLSK